MTTDLALLAERRGGVAALFGLLLLEEPGPELAGLVGAVPALAPLGSGDPAMATAYERIFVRGVPLFESVFRNDDGQRGGEALARVVERYERVGFEEHRDRRWRVAGVDHLGLELRCYAHLCRNEAAAWRDGVPDAAVRAVETERSFLADHMSTWAQVALDAVRNIAGDTPYGGLTLALGDFLVEEHDRLRPGPMFDRRVEPISLPASFGPARLTRLLLAPATCGVWLDEQVISHAARSIGAPWRPSDPRSALRHLIETADASGDLAVMLGSIRDAVRAAAFRHGGRASDEPANEATWRSWQARGEAMAGLLHDVIERNRLAGAPRAASESITVCGDDAAALADAIDEMITELRSRGFGVDRLDGVEHSTA